MRVFFIFVTPRAEWACQPRLEGNLSSDALREALSGEQYVQFQTHLFPDHSKCKDGVKAQTFRFPQQIIL
jgi:hypothetical protein